ncbi:MAG TPA: DUF3109 family protein [Bacteroidales bacterium]|jgi:hypothetical protein|nr:DUF3109 family protein [Bacteroidales bacterium]
MLRIGNYIFSLDILEKKFKCDLPQCLGNCCRYGDSGAPLTQNEADILEEIREDVKPYLRREGIEAINLQGTSTLDFENDLVTPLVGNEECAYAILEGSIFMCGIEKAWMEGVISFQKPLSCHLFPARVKHFSGLTAINYQELSICHSAVRCGKSQDVYVYEFLKAPLIRAFGQEVYDDLCLAAEELRKET